MLGVGDAPTARAHRALTPPWGVPGLPAMSHELHVLRPMSHVLPWPVTANYRGLPYDTNCLCGTGSPSMVMSEHVLKLQCE